MDSRSETTKTARGRLEEVDCLRGVAILSVCISHFSAANNGLPADSMIRWVGTHGWLGVEIFFVISGFIIPYSLYRGGYTPSNYTRFVAKRMLRLDPPYVLAVLLAISIAYLASHAPGYRGHSLNYSVPQVLLHAFYLNAVFGFSWVNPVFWTLAIEFQYYLIVGLVFLWISHSSAERRAFLFLALSVLSLLLPQRQFLFHYLFLFMLGMLTFQVRVRILTRLKFLLWLVPIAIAIGTWFTLGDLHALVGVATALTITFARFRSSALLALGSISYSLYLIHIPIGGRLVNLGGRYVDGSFQSLALITVALVISILCAWVLYAFVEKPAQRWSSSLGYMSFRAHS